MFSANETENCFSLVIELLEERDLSFAEFGPKRPYTAPTEIEADERVAQPLETIGGPPGTRTLDHRVKSPVLYQLS